MKLFISAEEIRTKIEQLSKKLNADFYGKEVLLIMVMKGAFCFVADLIRHLSFPVTIEYISASSYGAGGTQRGELSVKGLEALVLGHKHVLVVDDIFDSGHTLFHIVREVKKSHPLTLHSLVLLLKEHPRILSYVPDYYLFTVGDAFVVGYGMDFNERYRELPGIYMLDESHS
jgi:hypoxanthine phosphoribosyltransferase